MDHVAQPGARARRGSRFPPIPARVAAAALGLLLASGCGAPAHRFALGPYPAPAGVELFDQVEQALLELGYPALTTVTRTGTIEVPSQSSRTAGGPSFVVQLVRPGWVVLTVRGNRGEDVPLSLVREQRELAIRLRAQLEGRARVQVGRSVVRADPGAAALEWPSADDPPEDEVNPRWGKQANLRMVLPGALLAMAGYGASVAIGATLAGRPTHCLETRRSLHYVPLVGGVLGVAATWDCPESSPWLLLYDVPLTLVQLSGAVLALVGAVAGEPVLEMEGPLVLELDGLVSGEGAGLAISGRF